MQPGSAISAHLHTGPASRISLAFALGLSSTRFVQLGPHCYALAGFAYRPPWSVNAGFVCGNRRTLIVDTGPTVEVLAKRDGLPTLVRQGKLMAATFHPELTPDDRRVHKAFVDLVKLNLESNRKAS